MLYKDLCNIRAFVRALERGEQPEARLVGKVDYALIRERGLKAGGLERQELVYIQELLDQVTGGAMPGPDLLRAAREVIDRAFMVSEGRAIWQDINLSGLKWSP